MCNFLMQKLVENDKKTIKNRSSVLSDFLQACEN